MENNGWAALGDKGYIRHYIQRCLFYFETLTYNFIAKRDQETSTTFGLYSIITTRQNWQQIFFIHIFDFKFILNKGPKQKLNKSLNKTSPSKLKNSSQNSVGLGLGSDTQKAWQATLAIVFEIQEQSPNLCWFHSPFARYAPYLTSCKNDHVHVFGTTFSSICGIDKHYRPLRLNRFSTRYGDTHFISLPEVSLLHNDVIHIATCFQILVESWQSSLGYQLNDGFHAKMLCLLDPREHPKSTQY